MTSLPDDLLITAADEVKIRQDLLLVALGKRPADRSLRVGKLLDVHSRTWMHDQEIVMRGKRIAWVGPAGEYQGQVKERFHEPKLAAVPGFGEVHKHIESSHITPEYEAALVLPRGNTWTCEASHEFSNVDGAHNLEFWLTARRHGSPMKIFPLPGSAVPPTAYEWGGGYYGYDEQADFLKQSLMVAGLDRGAAAPVKTGISSRPAKASSRPALRVVVSMPMLPATVVTPAIENSGETRARRMPMASSIPGSVSMTTRRGFAWGMMGVETLL